MPKESIIFYQGEALNAKTNGCKIEDTLVTSAHKEPANKGNQYQLYGPQNTVYGILVSVVSRLVYIFFLKICTVCIKVRVLIFEGVLNS